QVYWINSTAGDIQFAADAGALAAEKVVAEYRELVIIADAVVLSLSLFGLLVFGVAIVVSCIPSCQGVGTKLMDFGRKVFDSRDNVAKQASAALNGLQKALPFLCVVSATATIGANTFSAEGEARYVGIAIPLPLAGEEAAFPSDDAAQTAGETIGEANQETAKQTDAANEAHEKMQSSKLEGYLADCGNAPNYCMSERAGRLARLSGTQNPQFSSIELWKFDYALARAQAYYAARLAQEAPANSLLAEQVKSFARTRFYTYAKAQLATGYAHTDSDGVLDAYFPLLPRNNGDVKRTTLYTERVYPVDADGLMHGTPNCPDYREAGAGGHGSMSDLDAGTYSSCERCDISLTTIGKVAAPSTSVDNGFEYHYRIVAAAAERYEQASRDYRDESADAKNSANQAFDLFREAMEALKTPRLDPKPPGRAGCIALAFDMSSHAVPGVFSTSLVAGEAQLQPRVALSAATLASEPAEQGNTLIAAFLERTKQHTDSTSLGGQALGVFGGILTLWGDALLMYSEGTEALTKGVGDFLRAIPLVGSTPLASWAESALSEAIRAVGLQGVDLSTPKPVLVNTAHVIRASGSEAFGYLGKAQELYSSLPGSSSGTLAQSTLDGLLLEVERQGGALLEGEFTLFTLSFGDLPFLPRIPIKVSLPEQVSARGKNLLSDAIAAFASLFEGGGSSVVWE
ncbi:MAG: hypothetical protein LBU48_01400, partial [Coriobacteriales bacterium]|nr:hypothetical protein [Coriobacteriales bacterium]